MAIRAAQLFALGLALASCTVVAEPFGPLKGRVIPNRYAVVPTILVGKACPRERPLDNTPCADAVSVGSHCEYAGGSRGDVEHVSPKFSVHTRCVSEAASTLAPRWITIPSDVAPALCSESADAKLACVESVCRNYTSGACGCGGAESARVNEICPADQNGCPALRPHHGQPCVGVQFCDYDGCDRGALMQCLGNVWQMAEAVCP